MLARSIAEEFCKSSESTILNTPCGTLIPSVSSHRTKTVLSKMALDPIASDGNRGTFEVPERLMNKDDVMNSKIVSYSILLKLY